MTETAAARWAAVGGVIVGSALVVATLVRPPHGYRTAVPLLEALGGGAACAILLLLGLTAATGALRRPATPAQRSWRSVPSYGVLGASAGVLVLVVVTAAVWPAPQGRRPASTTRTAFQRWQPETVPLALRYAAAVRVLAAVLGAPQSSKPTSTIRARRARAQLDVLARAVAVQQRRFHQTKALAQIIPRFRHAIALALRSAQVLGLAGKASVSPSVTMAERRRARADLRRSQIEMQAFVYESNFLGMQLSAARR